MRIQQHKISLPPVPTTTPTIVINCVQKMSQILRHGEKILQIVWWGAKNRHGWGMVKKRCPARPCRTGTPPLMECRGVVVQTGPANLPQPALPPVNQQETELQNHTPQQKPPTSITAINSGYRIRVSRGNKDPHCVKETGITPTAKPNPMELTWHTKREMVRKGTQKSHRVHTLWPAGPWSPAQHLHLHTTNRAPIQGIGSTQHAQENTPWPTTPL